MSKSVVERKILSSLEKYSADFNDDDFGKEVQRTVKAIRLVNKILTIPVKAFLC